MKRFMVFGNKDRGPNGGMGDFMSDHDTLEEAEKSTEPFFENGRRMTSFLHILDSEAGKVVRMDSGRGVVECDIPVDGQGE